MITSVHWLGALIMVGSYNWILGGKFKTLSVMTYNTALLDTSICDDNVFPNNRLERRDQIIQMLSNFDTDLICLQEVWFGEDVEAIVNGVSATFPYSFSKIHTGATVNGSPGPHDAPVCDFQLVHDFYYCADFSGCMRGSLTTMRLCVFALCHEEFAVIVMSSTEDCISCLLSSFPDVIITFEKCCGVGANPSFRKMNTPGLLLLSKHVFRVPEYTDFFPGTTELVARGYITAKVSGLFTVCTHLSADMEPYTEGHLANVYGFASYAEQNQYEVGQLISTFGSRKRVVLLGDFNTGQAGNNGVVAELETSYNLLTAVFVTSVVTECTYCSKPENPYNGGNDVIIDHVMGKGVNVWRVRRVNTVCYSDGSVPFNATLNLPLSDHFGVEAQISRN